MSQEDSSIKPDKTIDMNGLLCPEPVFRTKQTIKEMNIDEILEKKFHQKSHYGRTWQQICSSLLDKGKH